MTWSLQYLTVIPANHKTAYSECYQIPSFTKVLPVCTIKHDVHKDKTSNKTKSPK